MQKSPICKSIKDILAKTISTERKLRHLRPTVNFNFLDLDTFNNGFITGADLKRFLYSQSISAKDKEIYLFLNQWDWDRDGKLTLPEITNWCMCEINGNSTNNEFSEMLLIELRYLIDLEEDKYRLKKIEGFQILDAYEFIVGSKGVVNTQCLINFLEDFEYVCEPELLWSVVKRIARGMDNDFGFFEFADYLLCNQAFLQLGPSYPNSNTSPMEFNYSIEKKQIEKTGRNSKVFSRTYEKFKEMEENQWEYKKQTEFNQEIEILRRALAGKKDFSLKKIYKFFAGNKKNVGIKQFTNSINRLGIEKNSEEIALFFMEYDKDNDGNLSLNDFFNMFAASCQEYQKLLQNHVHIQCRLSAETLIIVSRMLNILMSEFSNYNIFNKDF